MGNGTEPAEESGADKVAKRLDRGEEKAEAHQPTNRAEKPAKQKKEGPGMIARVRTIVARVIWIICVIAALSLAIGALLIVLDANKDNALVNFILNLADTADLGIFDKDEGIKTFTGKDAVTKNVLVNWGIGALAWLIVGRIVERLVRP